MGRGALTLTTPDRKEAKLNDKQGSSMGKSPSPVGFLLE